MWKDIFSWEDLYEIDDKGNVRNKLTNKIKSWDINSSGYARVTLYNKYHNPSRKRYFVHRLVAETFINNFTNMSEVNHKDSDKLNNSVSNLEWTTRLENEKHSILYGNKKYKYKPFIVVFNNNIIKHYNTKNELALELNVTSICVKHWLHNKNKGYLKYNIVSINYK